jgi:hypothetical protein
VPRPHDLYRFAAESGAAVPAAVRRASLQHCVPQRFTTTFTGAVVAGKKF